MARKAIAVVVVCLAIGWYSWRAHISGSDGSLDQLHSISPSPSNSSLNESIDSARLDIDVKAPARSGVAPARNVSGRVVDAGTNRPVPAARVAMLSYADSETLRTAPSLLAEYHTTADGSFVLPGAGEHEDTSLLVEKKGYHTQLVSLRDNSGVVLLQPIGAGVLRGLVTDELGAPVTSFRISAFFSMRNGFQGGSEQSYESPDGLFVMNLPTTPDGATRLEYRIDAQGFIPSLGNRQDLDLLAQGASVHVRLKRAEHVVVGFVFDAHGAPVPSARVTLLLEDEGERHSSLTNEAGAFSFALLSSSPLRALTAEKDGWAPTVISAQVSNPLATGEWIITMTPGSLVAGKISTQGGAPLTGWRVRLRFIEGTDSPFEESMSWCSSTESDSLGRFQFEHVPLGTLVIGYDLPVQDVRTTTQTTGQQTLVVNSDVPALTLLVSEGASIAARISVQGMRSAALWVEILRDGEKQPVATARAKTGEPFVLTHLPKGHLSMRVWINNAQAARRSVDTLAGSVDLGNLTLESDDFESISLRR